MSRNEMKGLVRGIWQHMKVLWKGFLRTVVGTMVAGIMVLAVYGYAMIPTEGGYVAVCEFLVATMLMVLAVLFMYNMGGKAKAVRR